MVIIRPLILQVLASKWLTTNVTVFNFANTHFAVSRIVITASVFRDALELALEIGLLIVACWV